MLKQIPVDRNKLNDFCKQHHIRRLWLFGSALDTDFSQNSDVDILYEFQSGKTPGLDIHNIIRELSDLMGGRRVDFISEKYISPRIRNHPSFRKEILYEKGVRSSK
jgi:hypothetical protein